MGEQTPMTRDKVSEGNSFCLCPTDPHPVCSQTNDISTWTEQKQITQWTGKRPDEDAWANSATSLRWQDPSPTGHLAPTFPAPVTEKAAQEKLD